ncbi:peptidylprolyl isomerase [Nostoc sp. UCD121]|uniref:peptidylprolyl isomerase n=1 Tax=unclassified Nostoc TaxID=2593658 RepID=UPI00162A2061|nr:MULTISPECIES: peptidylprolyl isomerase [unclassified Nostoc]MBC1225300.1 peptidylprolyl isomerase [Nostoc sp. UCD120]MBC1278368.1 peptidylprolyl isomerase [Nostoc sp. UCD121]
MKETLEKTQLQPLQKITFPEIPPATEAEVIAYLHRSFQIAEIAVKAERDALILNICEQLNLTASDEELQAGGDKFRLEHKLLGASETLSWLSVQRITVEDWSNGIKLSLLTQKLKELLFGEIVDNYYIQNRQNFRRIALSQILVRELTQAQQIAYQIQEENASFCALALEYSKGKQSKENGGFAGIRFFSELLPEIAAAISQAKEGELIGPVQTTLGYHIIRVEKLFPLELTESLREEVLESFFQAWLQGQLIFVLPGN